MENQIKVNSLPVIMSASMLFLIGKKYATSEILSAGLLHLYDTLYKISEVAFS